MDSSSQDRNLPATERKLQERQAMTDKSRARAIFPTLPYWAAAPSPCWSWPHVCWAGCRLALSQQLSFDSLSVMQTGSMLSRLQDMVILGLARQYRLCRDRDMAAVLGTIATGGWVASLKPLAPTSAASTRSRALASCSQKRS
jgi:flagellar biosynthetic protein FlhB